MTGPARSSRRGATRLLLLAVTVLVLANLFAPDAATRWAGTQPEGWRRDVAGALTRPLVRVAEELSLGQPLEMVTGLFDGDPPTVTFAPATRSAVGTTTTTTTTTTTQVPPVGDAGEVGVPTTSTATATTPPSEAGEPGEAIESATGATTTSTTTSVATFAMPDGVPTVRTGSDDDPLRILAMGDSLMLDLQRGLERTLARRPDVAVEGRGALGFGFTVPHWDWDEDVLADYAGLVAEFRPDVVVVMIGANEFEGHVLEGEGLVPGSARWSEVLAERADEAMSRWRADGAHVYWWTTPRMRDPRFLTDALNEVWASATAAWGEAATDLDSMAVLGDEDGGYRDRMPDGVGGTVLLRKAHGVHFFEVGADLLALQLEQRLVDDGWLIAVG